MVTFVGTQSNFFDALNNLLELEYEAVEIYESAIKHLENIEYISQIKSFKQDHKKHFEFLNKYLDQKSYDHATGAGVKQLLNIAAISFSSLIGDNNVLKSLLGAEEDTNKAYERITSHKEKDSTISSQLDEFYNDEKKHKSWIEKTIAK